MYLYFSLEIKPKESTGAQVEEDNDVDDQFEQELRKANAEMINEVRNERSTTHSITIIKLLMYSNP